LWGGGVGPRGGGGGRAATLRTVLRRAPLRGGGARAPRGGALSPALARAGRGSALFLTTDSEPVRCSAPLHGAPTLRA
jgi:hypothetical protein